MRNKVYQKLRQMKQKSVIWGWNLFDSLTEQYRCESTWGVRSKIVENFCGGGVGIEIGASCYPVPILKHTISVKYVDYRDRNKVHDRGYAEGQSYVKVDILDDAERLDKIEDESLDFILVFHLLEHTKNPIGSIRVWMSKLKRGGRLVVAIPDMSTIFDKGRQLTEFNHLCLDDTNPSDNRDYGHYLEYVRYSWNCKDNIEQKVKELLEEDIRIHYHCWNFYTYFDFLKRVNIYLNNIFSIISFNYNLLNNGESGKEIIAILEKE